MGTTGQAMRRAFLGVGDGHGPTALCPNCGYSRPEGASMPCPECGTEAGRGLASCEVRTAVGSGLTLLMVWVPAGLIGFMGAQRLLIPGANATRVRVINGTDWILLVPCVAVSVGLASVALGFGWSVARRWVVRTAVVLVTLLLFGAADGPTAVARTGVPQHVVLNCAQTLEVMLFCVWGTLGCTILAGVAGQLELRLVGERLRRSVVWAAVVIAVLHLWTWCGPLIRNSLASSAAGPFQSPFSPPTPVPRPDALSLWLTRSVWGAESFFEFLSVALTLAAWAVVLMCRQRLKVLNARIGLQKSD